MSKFSEFFKKLTSNLDKVHVRAAFADVEHRIGNLFHHYEQQGMEKPAEKPEEKKNY